MNKNKYYSGIDWMRLIAAVLVITIHTSPLASYNTTGDFILTRVIARVAVPFFFMTTGYFTLSRYHYDNRKLLGFLKKTGIIYVAAIAVYLPLNIYNGYFNQANLLPNMLKDLVFDGTLYHLWYLPASMLGMLIAWQLVQKLDYSKGLIVAGLLYLIGLFGDSYYGIAVKLLEVQIARLHALLGQQRCHTADVFVDGHTVIIEHDDHRLAALPGIRQALVCQAAGQCAVTDEGDDVIVRPRERTRPGHAQRDGDRRGGVAGHKRIVHALIRLRKPGNAAELPQRGKRFAPSGQDLVHIALMTDVEHESVLFGAIYPVNRDRELYCAEIRRQMPAGFRKILDQKRTKFRTQCRNFFRRQRLQVGR